MRNIKLNQCFFVPTAVYAAVHITIHALSIVAKKLGLGAQFFALRLR